MRIRNKLEVGMHEDIRAYFRSRAEDELEAGRGAKRPEAARAHFLLAGYYFDRAFNSGWAIDGRDESPSGTSLARHAASPAPGKNAPA